MRKKRLAIFDFCKTLVAEDTVSGFFAFLSAKGYRAEREERIISELKGLRSREASLVEKALRMRMLSGAPESEVKNLFAEYYIRRVGPIRLTEVEARLLELRKQDYEIVLVSASFTELLENYRKDLGIPAEILANSLEFDGAVCTGRTVDSDCVSVGKLIRLKQRYRLEDYDLEGSYCFTDHIMDVPLLSLVGKRVVVRPPEGRDDWSSLFGCEVLRLARPHRVEVS